MKEPIYNQLIRQFTGPLDARTVFETKEDTYVYLNKKNTTAYPGMILYVKEENSMFYVTDDNSLEKMISYTDLMNKVRELEEQIEKLQNKPDDVPIETIWEDTVYEKKEDVVVEYNTIDEVDDGGL